MKRLCCSLVHITTMAESRRGTARYRRVGNGGPSVDESLFGPSGGGTTKKNGKGSASFVDPASASVVLTQSELGRIYNASIIKTEKQEMDDQEERERARAEKEHLARARKQRMIALSEKSKTNAKKSDIEVANIAKAAQLRKMGEDKRDRDSDVVKLLSSYATRATAFSIREQQLKDRHEREQSEKEYESRMDTLMEIDRVADIQRREAEESVKKQNRYDDLKVLTSQIQMRERARLIEAEAREQESVAIKNQIKRYEAQDLAQAETRKIELEKSRAEVLRANAAAIAKKSADREAEKKEMADILMYQAMKDAELAKREAEEAELDRAKKERQKALLAMQEKSQGRAAELDELRARRATEEKERITRRKEKAKALFVRNETIKLLDARKKQEEDNRALKEMNKARDLYEWQKQLEHSAKSAGRDDEERESKHRNNMEHREKLFSQIHSDEERKRAARGSEMEEGHRFRQALISDEARFSIIRDQMVDDLQRKGVDTKYLGEMRQLDVGKILRR